MKRKEVSLYLAAAVIVISSLIPALPDTSVGSPRAIATALATGLGGAALLFRGTDRVKKTEA